MKNTRDITRGLVTRIKSEAGSGSVFLLFFFFVFSAGSGSAIHIFFMKETHVNSCERLTLTVVGATIDAQWEGMGDVGSARYEQALLPPCPTLRVLGYSN